MPRLHGMLTLDELTEKVNNGEIETFVIRFSDHFGRLIDRTG